MRSALRTKIGKIKSQQTGTQSLISVDVDGEELWYSTSDVVLEPSPEAIATSLWLPALFHGRTIQMSDPVCDQWRDNLPRATAILNRWWRFPQLAPQLDAVKPTDISTSAESTVPSGVGLLFTGGVDSFFSLLQCARPVDQLIYVVDFDVPPQMPSRLSGFERCLREMCAERKLKPIVLRSNLRRHHSFQGPSWQQSHGAALIGASHLLAGSINELVVSSSYSHFHPRPWGSHWELDALWSSSKLKVTHFGEAHRRFDKLAKIVDDPIVHRYLRPCWGNPDGETNCSVCEKCIRTQICITACGDLSKFQVFKSSGALVERIDGLRKIGSPALLDIYRDFLSIGLPPQIEASIERLIARSRLSAWRKQVRQAIRTTFNFGGVRQVA